MESVIKLYNFLNRVSLFIAGMMICVIMICIVQDVIRRYFFDAPSLWVLDITRFMLCYVIFLGLSPALKDGHHVSVDLFLERFGPKGRQWLELAARIMVVLFAGFFLWTLSSVTMSAFLDNRLSPTSVPVPLKWIYLIGPIGMLIFLFTSVVQLIMHVYRRGNNSKEI